MPPSPTSLLWVLCLLTAVAIASQTADRSVNDREPILYDAFTGRPLEVQRIAALNSTDLLPLCAISARPCSADEGRRTDGTCNNLRRPPRGAALTPYRRLLPSDFAPDWQPRVSSRGEPLPNARLLRTALLKDGRAEHPRLNHLAMFFLVAIVGEVTSLHDTVNYVILTVTCCGAGGDRDPRCLPIAVPPDDPYLQYSDVRCLNLTRALTYQGLGCRHPDTPLERINTVPPMLDLSLIYGNSEAASERGRERQEGLLRVDPTASSELPPSGSPACLNNQPPAEKRCHNTPNPATNAIIGANIVSIWLYRNHNFLARTLHRLNPCWDDERLFRVARDINIAYFQHIFYYDLVPTLLGQELPLIAGVISSIGGGHHIQDYNDRLDPTVSLEFVTATRWFHTLQEGIIQLYSATGEILGWRTIVDDTLRTGVLDLNRTLEGLTQAAFRQPSAAADRLIDPDMSERVLGGLQRVSDVVASDITKGRDLGIPPYNEYRKLCGWKPAKRWSDFLDVMDYAEISTLRSLYASPDDVELMVALLAERPAPGAEVPPTLACIMLEQLRHWRRADRFWYENGQHPGHFTPEQLKEVRKMSMARLMCDNADGVTRVPRNAFLLPQKNNMLEVCEDIPAPTLTPWADASCQHLPPSQTSHE